MKLLRQQSGLTLIEITIGLALLSTALLVAIISYTSISKLQQQGISVRTVQQNGRYALENVARDVRNSRLVCLPGGGTCTIGGANSIDLTDNLNNVVKYTYDVSTSQVMRQFCPTGNCAGAPTVSVSSAGVRIQKPVAPQYLFTYSSTNNLVRIDMTVLQSDVSLSPIDVYSQTFPMTTYAKPRGGS